MPASGERQEGRLQRPTRPPIPRRAGPPGAHSPRATVPKLGHACRPCQAAGKPSAQPWATKRRRRA
eukprot:11079988-Alexandrium_andersonii.AAC.1